MKLEYSTVVSSAGLLVMLKPYSRMMLVALLAGTAAAQQTPAGALANAQASRTETSSDIPVYKTTTRIVVVDVVVTDKTGAPVHGLKQSDFRVLEDGHEQAMKVFEEHRGDSLPVVPRAEVAAEPGTTVATNAGQEIHTSALNVILFDALNTASPDQSYARAQVQKAIAGLPPGSRIAIFVLRGSLHMVQGFTADTSLLAKAMDKDKSTLSGPWFNDPDMVLVSTGGSSYGAGSTGSTGSQLSGNAMPAGNMGNPNSILGSVGARDEEGLTSELRTGKTLQALSQLAEYLSQLPGKKNLLWLAGSFPFDLLPDVAVPPGGTVMDPWRGNVVYGEAMYKLALQMEAGHIAVFPVDVRGLVGNSVFGVAAGRPNLDAYTAFAGAEMSQEQVMNNIAHQTGGRPIYNTNDITGEIIESLNQGDNFYTVAYSPADKNWNGKYRKIEVKTELKGVNLYYRRGYLADDPSKPGNAIRSDALPKFAVAMVHGAPERAEIGLTVKAAGSGTYIDEKERKPPELRDRNEPTDPKPGKPLFVTHLKGTTEVYALDCTVDAGSVWFMRTQNGQYQPRLAFTLLAYDADGTILNAETGMFMQSLNDAQYQAVLKKGLTVRQTMEVPLGRVYLRVGVHDLFKDKVGATEMPLLVTRATQTAAK